MFRVIVAGGIALTATAPGLVAGCGGSVATAADGGGADSFPVEGVDAFPQETAQQVDAFPQEGPPPPMEAGLDARIVDSGADQDAFPHEGPNLEAGFFDVGVVDAGVVDTGVVDTGVVDATPTGDGAAAPDGFPHETAVP
jgi:hypothetical protein